MLKALFKLIKTEFPTQPLFDAHDSPSRPEATPSKVLGFVWLVYFHFSLFLPCFFFLTCIWLKASPTQGSLCYHRIEKKPGQHELHQPSCSTENCSLSEVGATQNTALCTACQCMGVKELFSGLSTFIQVEEAELRASECLTPPWHEQDVSCHQVKLALLFSLLTQST